MDRGAARSRKRAAQIERQSQGRTVTRPEPGPSRLPSSPRRWKPLPQARARLQNETSPVDPDQYKPKAIRTSVALIYNEAPFSIPPSSDLLAKVRRVDLAGSGCTDVSWLEGSGATWLSLAGCRVEKGWDAVGGLSELSVLNISNCGLTSLPTGLQGLKKLKAIVAMHNDWTKLDSSVVAAWTELNSLIVSHSPNLTSLLSTLNQLYQLSKLTFSHCPKLTAGSLPDLSDLPLLRDVKMNNLPLLTSLPSHLPHWGTGEMPSSSNFEAGPWTPRRGDGLEVLDLGNCSLSFDAISPIFEVSKSSAKTQWSHLRSLSLHSNPLATTHPDYVERLQASPALPNLQIIDAKRVRERKRKGEVQESKIDRRRREKREERMKPSGTNVARGGMMRAWGQEQEVIKAEAPTAAIEEKVEAEKGGERKRKRNPVIDGGMEGRSKVSANQASQKSRPYLTSQIPSTSNEDRRGGPSRQKPDPPPAQPPAIINPDTGYLKSIPEITAKTVAEPPVIPKPSKTQTSVVQVIEISKRASEKGKKRKKGKVEDSARSGGVDPRELFAKPPVIEGENTGLGVGGW